jgi:hypothetical protein
MTIDYRNAGAWGAGSGAGAGGLLTSEQVDNNFYEIDSRLQAVEAALAAGMVFDDPAITAGSGSITFHFTDGSDTTDVVVPLPVALYKPRGAWLPSTSYSYLDLVTVVGLGIYLVLEDHVSDTTFDPDAGDSDPLYNLMFPLPAENEAPEPLDVAGATRTLSLDDAGTYLRFTNVAGCAITVPTNASVAFPIGTEIHIRQAGDGPVSLAGATGAVTINPQRTGDAATTWRGQTLLLKKTATNTWDLSGPVGPSALVGTISTDTYTPALTDQDKYLRCTHASGCVVTVPADASADFEVGAEIHFRQSAGASIIFVPEDSSVAINSRADRLDETAALGAVATLKKIAAAEWDLFGDLASEGSA